MNIGEQFDTHNLHHAYMVVGERSNLEEILKDFLVGSLQFSVHGNPDFSHVSFETFGIDDARSITEQHARKSFHGTRKIFLISTNSVTLEAQNALLKLFEEPMPGNHFFLIIPDESSIIPTLRSRMVLVHDSASALNTKQGNAFLQSSIADRLKVVSEIVESKDKERAKELVRSIAEVVHEKDVVKYSGILRDLVKVEEYLSDRAPSIKMLLEHIAYRIPTA